MKTFSQAINEGIVVPEFIHPQLNKPNDPNGKFWTLIGASNAESDKSSKKQYVKVCKLANDLYSELSLMTPDDNLTKAMGLISDALNYLNKSGEDAPEELSAADTKYMRNVLTIIQGIDARLSKHRWYKESSVDVKAGYVPLKGTSKDPKIKYRVLVTLKQPVSEQQKRSIDRDVMSMTPLHRNYVAGVEWSKDLNKFSILITNSEGYKR